MGKELHRRHILVAHDTTAHHDAKVKAMGEDIYWQQYAARYSTSARLIPEFGLRPSELAVCIPVYAEPSLLLTLESLLHCEHPNIRITVFLFFNADDRMTEAEHIVHRNSWHQAREWINQHQGSTLQFVQFERHAGPGIKWGVGWARKIVMDEAARFLPAHGIIVCLDADCQVEENYLHEVQQYFQMHPECMSASIYFEHSLAGLSSDQLEAIITYELHLRYLERAKQWTGHPLAGHTVGSAMAVRRAAYLKQGGMNTRQAGEDFYFLQKFKEIGGHHEIKSTAVYPSSRISHRVPFGTGRAMESLLSKGQAWRTIAFDSFRKIRPLFQQVQVLREMAANAEEGEGYVFLKNRIGLTPEGIGFLIKIDFVRQVHSIIAQTSDQGSFQKRFFRYFNAFVLIKYTHYMREHGFPDVQVTEAVAELAEENDWEIPPSASALEQLKVLRSKDRYGDPPKTRD